MIVKQPAWESYISRRLKTLSLNRSDTYPTADCLSRAWRIISSVLGPESPTPSVLPSDDGGVDFVWHKNGWHIDLEVTIDSTWVWVKNGLSGETWHGELDDHRLLIRDLLSEPLLQIHRLAAITAMDNEPAVIGPLTEGAE